MGAGARTHPWGGASPFEMHYSIAFKHQSMIGRLPLGEILYPPLDFVTSLWVSDAFVFAGVLAIADLRPAGA